ncbi:hypothetical protein OROMI_019562 [Orobanche minor]
MAYEAEQRAKQQLKFDGICIPQGPSYSLIKSRKIDETFVALRSLYSQIVQDGKPQDAIVYGRSEFDKLKKLSIFSYLVKHIIGLLAGLAYQRCGSELVAALWITEMSSPLLHLRELLKELGYGDTDLNLAADVAFAITFTFARMIGGPYLTYVTLSAHNPILIKKSKIFDDDPNDDWNEEYNIIQEKLMVCPRKESRLSYK